MPLLRVDHVSFRYGEQWVLRGSTSRSRRAISSCDRAQRLRKTTLLRVIDGSSHPRRGRCCSRGREIGKAATGGPWPACVGRGAAVFGPRLSLLRGGVVLMGRAPRISRRWRFEGDEDHRIARQGHGDDGHARPCRQGTWSLSPAASASGWLIARALARSRGSCSWTSRRLSWTSAPGGLLRPHPVAQPRPGAHGHRRGDHDMSTWPAHYCDRIILLKDGPSGGQGPSHRRHHGREHPEGYETRVMVNRHPGTGSAANHAHVSRRARPRPGQ